MGIVLFAGRYSKQLCQQHPDKVFVFGDNLKRFGKGGQAIIRDEPNALGIVTKRKPARTHLSYFEEGNEDDVDNVLADIGWVWQALRDGKTVVIPVTSDNEVSLGRERAELPERAPSIYKLICMHVDEMIDSYGERFVREADAL